MVVSAPMFTLMAILIYITIMVLSFFGYFIIIFTVKRKKRKDLDEIKKVCQLDTTGSCIMCGDECLFRNLGGKGGDKHD